MFAGEQEEEHVLLASHKANALQHLWEETLSLRIALQKPFDLANQLPVIDLQELFTQEKKKKKKKEEEEGEDGGDDDEHVEEEGNPQTLRESLYNTTTQLLTLLEEQSSTATTTSTTSVSGSAHDEKKKKTKKEVVVNNDEVLWSRIENCQNMLQSGWEVTLNKWSARLHYGSEKAKAQLKVFNQSAWDQIENTLSDERRLMERSRPSVEDSQRLDLSHELSHILPEEQEHQHHLHGLVDGLYFHPRGLGGDDDDDEGNHSHKNKNKKRKTFITTTTQHHHGSGGSHGNDNLRANDLAVLRAYKKKKANNVDRKASKGRRLRYTVQDGGQGGGGMTMASTMDRDRLFASLFQ
eukprot:scaffold106_cov177-Ochromonas_danica.AAC.7